MTLKQEIKALKMGQEKIFKTFDNEYITIRKTKTKGLEIYIDVYYDKLDYAQSIPLEYEELKDNFKEFELISTYNELDY